MLNNHDLCTRSLSKSEPSGSFFDLKLSSPAKINLFFKVLSKRIDGYHDIASLYQAIGLFDMLFFTKADSFRLTSSDPSLEVDGSNLISKAVTLFSRKTGVSPAVHIHLEKNIPMQAGLGGGSANAATALWGLNSMFKTGATNDELALWAAELGSDVPFFFSLGTSYCTGRGEILQHVSELPVPNQITIVKPNYGLSTQLVYSRCNILDLPAVDPAQTLHNILSGKMDFYNDLEVPSFSLAPQLFAVKKHLLSAGFSHVIMSGSGSAFFCFGNADLSTLQNYYVREVRFAKRSLTGWYE